MLYYQGLKSPALTRKNILIIAAIKPKTYLIDPTSDFHIGTNYNEIGKKSASFAKSDTIVKLYLYGHDCI